MSLDIKPGTWANITTNISIKDGYVSLEGGDEDIVKSPVFVISREEYPLQITLMCIDQRKELLIWYNEKNDRLNKRGTIAGDYNGSSFHARITSVFKNCTPQESERSILSVAEEQKKRFLTNNPDMENCFFDAPPKEGSALCCPITQLPFVDPVTAPDGRNYERTAITKWIREKGTSPFTNQPMREDQLITNFGLKPV